MTDATETNGPQTADGALTRVQLRRAAALDVARQALIARTGLFGSAQVGSIFSVQDLLTVADWVLGVQPADILEQAAEALPDGLEFVGTFKPSALDNARPEEPDFDWDGANVEGPPLGSHSPEDGGYPEEALPR